MLKAPRQYDPCAQWKKELRLLLAEHKPAEPYTGPVSLSLTFLFPYRKKHYRTGKHAGELKANAPTYHCSRPDLDNLEKLVMDAMAGVFFLDDSQVAEKRSWKGYARAGCTQITISKRGERADGPGVQNRRMGRAVRGEP